jgi:hypothetical protein
MTPVPDVILRVAAKLDAADPTWWMPGRVHLPELANDGLGHAWRQVIVGRRVEAVLSS